MLSHTYYTEKNSTQEFYEKVNSSLSVSELLCLMAIRLSRISKL